MIMLLVCAYALYSGYITCFWLLGKQTTAAIYEKYRKG